jgi:hypothetical protein
MFWLPSFRETLILPRTARDIHQRLSVSTSSKPFVQPDESELLFNGWVMEDRLRISLRLRRTNYYIPLVIGQIEESSTGCILLLQYRFFPTTLLLLQLWTILVVLGAAMGFYQTHHMHFLPGAAAILATIYFIAWSNFKIHLRATREAIHRIIA